MPTASAEALREAGGCAVGVSHGDRLRCLWTVNGGAEHEQGSVLSGRQRNGLTGALHGIRRIRRTKVELNAIENAVRGQQV